MSQKEKLLQKFLERPESLKYSQILLLLETLGFEHIPAKGSHQKFKHPQLDQDLIFPVHQNDCKSYYKVKASKIIRDNHLT